MVTIDFGLMATILSVLAAVGGGAIALLKVWQRFNRMEEKIEHSGKLHRILAEGLYACLDGLHQQGCNGEVTKALNTLHRHLFESIDP